jgi:hypothetical protein
VSNLTTTQPAAFDALLGLLQAAGAAQPPGNPPIAVLDTAVTQYAPSTGYVLLEAIEQHEFDIAALGSYAFYETYDICGRTQYVQGVTGNSDWQVIRDQTFLIHESVVQATVVANRGANQTKVLGTQAPNQLLWIVPTYQRYTPQPSNSAGLYIGNIDWRFSLKARITAA